MSSSNTIRMPRFVRLLESAATNSVVRLRYLAADKNTYVIDVASRVLMLTILHLQQRAKELPEVDPEGRKLDLQGITCNRYSYAMSADGQKAIIFHYDNGASMAMNLSEQGLAGLRECVGKLEAIRAMPDKPQ